MRPVSVDDMPIIGKFPGLENVYINSGHGGKGTLESFASAEMISQIVSGKTPVFNTTQFTPTRFYF